MVYIFLSVFLSFSNIFNQVNDKEVNVVATSSALKSFDETSPVDIAGHWEGTITRDEGGGRRTTYEMQLDIVQKDKEITGISYVHYEDGSVQYRAKMALQGKINSNYFKYIETKIISSDMIPNTEWCIKKAELIHSIQDTRPTLEGIWEGVTSQGECTPGRVFLQKKPPRV